MAARASQAALAGNDPEGSWTSGPSVQSKVADAADDQPGGDGLPFFRVDVL